MRVLEGTFKDALCSARPVAFSMQEDLKWREAEAENSGGNFGSSLKRSKTCMLEGVLTNLRPEENGRVGVCHIGVLLYLQRTKKPTILKTGALLCVSEWGSK